MAEMRDHKDMPNTGERREITARVNAKEAETVQQSQKLVSKTRQLSRKPGREEPVAKRQSTEGPISKTDSVIRGIVGRI